MSDSLNQLIASGGAAAKPIDWNAMLQSQNALIANQNALRDQNAQKAIGQIYQQAYNPLTQSYDMGKINQGIAQSPQALGNAQKLIQGAGEATGAQTSANTAQFKLDASKYATVNDALTAALAGDDAGLQGRLVLQAKRLIDAGVIPQDVMLRQMASLPSDPTQLRTALTTMHTQSLPAEQREGVLYGKPITQTGPGGVTIGGTVDPRTGAVTPAPSQRGLAQGQTPGDLNTIVKIGTNPDGSDRMGTQRQAQNLAEGRDANDNGPNASPLGTGRLPTALRNPNRPAPAGGTGDTAPDADPAASPAPAQPGFTVGQGPATSAAQSATGSASSAKFQDIVSQGVKARSQDALLATMASEAQGIRTGPGADMAGNAKRIILGLGAQFGTSFGVDTDKLAKQESVVKIANQLADAQGAGSDERLRVTAGANPSLYNTPAGLDLIIRQLRGNADYARVRQQLAATYPNKADIEGFEAKHGANLDPRVFQYERLNPSQKADYFNGLSDKAAFIKAHDWAAAHGVLTAPPPQAAPAPAAAPAAPPQVPTGY
jgi:hypothetical protein